MRIKNLEIQKTDLPIILGFALIISLILLAGFYLAPLRDQEVSIENALYHKWAGFSIAILVICIFPKDMRGIKYILLFMMIGCILNSAALAMNDGYMPVSALTYVEGHHIPMTGTTRLPFLCDWIFGGMSIGDLFLFLPLPIVVISLGRYWKEKCKS